MNRFAPIRRLSLFVAVFTAGHSSIRLPKCQVLSRGLKNTATPGKFKVGYFTPIPPPRARRKGEQDLMHADEHVKRNPKNLFRAFAILLMLMVAACGTNEEVVLPTLIDGTAIALNETATATAQIALVASQQPPTLPPTWTPSPEPTIEPTIEVVQQATPTPVTGSGFIYYIFNGDSVARLAADGSGEQLILVGGAPSDLTLSPDGTLLAYVMQGNGSAREVFVSSLDGTYTQQVSCLGYARVLAPTWKPDSQEVVFAASQTSDGALGVYVAGIAGSGQCPTGNNQRLVAQLDVNRLGNFTWNPDGTLVFFDSDVIYGIDIVNGQLYPPLTQLTGYGPDSAPAHNPRDFRLLYVKSQYDEREEERIGAVFQVNVADISQPPLQEQPHTALNAVSLRWSLDGSLLAIAVPQGVWVQNQRTNTSIEVARNTNFFPQPVFSPDGNFVAYVDGGTTDITIQQIFTVGSNGQGTRQITTHQEGTITYLNWGTN